MKRSLIPQVALKKEIESFMEANKELLDVLQEGMGETEGGEMVYME